MRIPIDLPAWNDLQKHAAATRDQQMRDLFAKDPKRAESFSSRWNEILLDYSKNRITADTLNLLHKLLREAKVEELRDRMFRGEKINFTENRTDLVAVSKSLTSSIRGLCSLKFLCRSSVGHF